MRWWRKFFACENDDFVAEANAREHVCDMGAIHACERELKRLETIHDNQILRAAQLENQVKSLFDQQAQNYRAISDLRLAIRSAAQSRTHKYSRDRGTGAIQARIATMPRLT